MDNKTQSFQFRKTKLALAVAMTVSLAACGVDGDEGSTSTSNANTQTDATQNTVDNQKELKGTVQGVVVDTNGNPVAGVKVYLGSQETETNAGGQYVFTNVAVTNVNGVNNEGNEADDDVTQTLVVTVAGSATHLGALVTVTPQAQVNNTGGQGNGQDGGNSDVTIQTFVDGFTAQAGTAVLPQLSAGVYGYLRDCRTGQPLANATDAVKLDFSTVTANNDVNVGVSTDFKNGVQITNSEHSLSISTDENGRFQLDNVAANSTYAYVAGLNWFISANGTPVSTTGESSHQFLGTIEVCPTGFTPGANAAPYIRSIGNSISETTDEGYTWTVLSKGVDGTEGKEIVINFSEALNVDNIDLDAVVVTRQLSFSNYQAGEARVDIATDADGNKIISMSEDGRSMTLRLATALPEMTKFSVWFPRWQYRDMWAYGSAEIVTGDNDATQSDPDATNNDIVRDDLATVAAGSLNGLTLTAKSIGTQGNSIALNVGAAAAANQVFAISVSGSTITVTPATDGANAVTTTAADIAAAILGDVTANALVSASGNATVATAGTSVTLTGGSGAAAGSIGSGERGIGSDYVNNSQFKIDYIRTRMCTYITPKVDISGVTGEQLIQTLPAEQLPETAATWDNGVNGSGAVSNLNGQESATAGIDTGDRIATRWGITYDNDQAVVVGSLGTLDSVNDLLVSVYRGSSNITGSANVVKYSTGGGNYGIDVDNVRHGDVVRLTPTAAFGIVGTTQYVDLLDLIAPTTTLQENYNLYTEAGYNRDTADSGLVAAGEGGEVSVPGAAAQLGDPIVYIQPRHLTPVIASTNLADRGAEFDAIERETMTDGAVANPLYAAADFAAWTAADRANPIGFAFSENIFVSSSATFGAAATTALTNPSYINSLTRNIDGELTAATGLSADIATADVADMLAFANNDHGLVIDFAGQVADKLTSAAAGNNMASTDDKARILIQDAMPAFVTSSRWTGTTVEFTFNEAVSPDGTAPGQTVFCFTNPTVGDADGDCADAGEYAVTLDASLRNDASTANDEDPGAYTLSTDGKSLTLYVDGSLVQALMVGDTVTNPEFFFNEDADTAPEQHVAVSWDNLDDARGNAWATFDHDVNTTAAANARYLVNAPRFLTYDDVGPFEVTNARFIYVDEAGGGAGDTDGNVTFTITFSHPLDLRDNTTPMGAALAGAATPWNGTDRSWDGTNVTERLWIDEVFSIDLDGGAIVPAQLANASGTADLSVTISSDYRTITLVTSEAPDAIDALSTVIIFNQLLDSSIIDGAQWATLNYVVTNTQ